jgi:hypothetical protein
MMPVGERLILESLIIDIGVFKLSQIASDNGSFKGC